jgi:hypothetical protein
MHEERLNRLHLAALGACIQMTADRWLSHPDKIIIGRIGPLTTTVVGAAVGWLPGGLTSVIGSPLTVLLAGVGDM